MPCFNSHFSLSFKPTLSLTSFSIHLALISPFSFSLSTQRNSPFLALDSLQMASTMLSLASASPSAIQKSHKSFGRTSMTVFVKISHFDGVSMAPPEPILQVYEEFKTDPNPLKLNLAVRAYRTEDLHPYVLDVVKKAEELMLEKGECKEYLPIGGLAVFNKVSAELLLGRDNPAIQQGRVATVQSFAGTGAMRLASEFIKRHFPDAEVLISSPTWSNHKNIFNDAAVSWSEYRYFDPKSDSLDFDAMIIDIKAAPNGSFVLLHGCAHNPTGIDPTPEQWEKIADVIQEKNHIPFFDIAYQGVASGNLDVDAWSVRFFVSRGLDVLVAQSYSKNLGLYAERIGALNFVCSSSDVAERVRSQLKGICLAMFITSPVHGARIVANIVGDPILFNMWKEEMKLMATRMKNVRQKLFHSLSVEDKSGKDWSFIGKQIGLFSITGLNKAQCGNMKKNWHVYMRNDGGISFAGLSLAKCEYLASAMIDSYYNVN